ncbi:hypothetical protein [Marinigracilibium pacificum]|uniref:Uncharacterized protein n=1 Tax=Marinigracilibium pacificum TaxID=2729599 RepID=A0A848IW60_9BACT|nr:hypothetical protein [Marinigracilibium pacificum]NMM47515.1 hypothetical protein [Marinigracilibium pacificum]
MYSLADRPRIETVNKIVQYVQATDLNKGMEIVNIGTIQAIEECLNNVKITLINSKLDTSEVYFSKFDRVMVE